MKMIDMMELVISLASSLPLSLLLCHFYASSSTLSSSLRRSVLLLFSSDRVLLNQLLCFFASPSFFLFSTIPISPHSLLPLFLCFLIFSFVYNISYTSILLSPFAQCLIYLSFSFLSSVSFNFLSPSVF